MIKYPKIDNNGYFVNDENILDKEYDNLKFNNKLNKKYFKKLSVIKKKEYLDLCCNLWGCCC